MSTRRHCLDSTALCDAMLTRQGRRPPGRLIYQRRRAVPQATISWKPRYPGSHDVPQATMSCQCVRARPDKRGSVMLPEGSQSKAVSDLVSTGGTAVTTGRWVITFARGGQAADPIAILRTAGLSNVASSLDFEDQA